MGQGASVAGLHWGSMPVVGPPPLALAVAVGLVSIVLLAALFLIDALATRERRRTAPRPAAAPPAVAAPVPAPASAEAVFPDLSRSEVSELALARLRRFAAIADDPTAGTED